MIRPPTPTTLRRRLVAAAVIAGVALAGTGCSASVPAPSASSAYSADVEIRQGRTDYTRNVFSISVTNTGSQAITIDAARFSSPGLATAAAYDSDPVTLPPGRTIDLRAPIPAVACDGDGSLGTVELRVGPGSGGGASSTVTVTPTDPNNTIERLVREGCIVHDVDAIVDIAPPTTLVVTGSGAAAEARIDLTITPTGAAGSVTIAGIRSTTLMSPLDGSDSWPLNLTVDAASAPSTVSLPMHPTRCDAHALADDKVGTVLVIDVSTSTDRSGRYLLPLPPAVKAEVYDYIVGVCGD